MLIPRRVVSPDASFGLDYNYSDDLHAWPQEPADKPHVHWLLNQAACISPLVRNTWRKMVNRQDVNAHDYVVCVMAGLRGSQV